MDFERCVRYREENPFLKIYGIRKGETFIGLTAFARWDSDTSIPVEKRWTWFDEFFIDEKYQGKGCAKEAVRLILRKIKEIYNPEFVVLSVRNDNPVAKKLYREMGFESTNLIYSEECDEVFEKDSPDEEDELIMTYSF